MESKKCMFLIPTSYNDGIEVSPEVIDGILSELYRVFGGYSVDGGVTRGVYPMKDGTTAIDVSLKIWIVLDEKKVKVKEKVAKLKECVRKYAKILKQESIYFEIMDWEGEFIEPEQR